MSTFGEMQQHLREATDAYIEAVAEASRLLVAEPRDRDRVQAAMRRREVLHDEYLHIARTVWQARFGG
jgi:hypothetical protein